MQDDRASGGEAVLVFSPVAAAVAVGGQLLS
jgi:hypothetical protein